MSAALRSRDPDPLHTTAYTHHEFQPVACEHFRSPRSPLFGFLFPPLAYGMEGDGLVVVTNLGTISDEAVTELKIGRQPTYGAISS